MDSVGQAVRFNSRLREEATLVNNAHLEAPVEVSTHASVRRRRAKREPVIAPEEFQLTPP